MTLQLLPAISCTCSRAASGRQPSSAVLQGQTPPHVPVQCHPRPASPSTLSQRCACSTSAAALCPSSTLLRSRLHRIFEVTPSASPPSLLHRLCLRPPLRPKQPGSALRARQGSASPGTATPKQPRLLRRLHPHPLVLPPHAAHIASHGRARRGPARCGQQAAGPGLQHHRQRLARSAADCLCTLTSTPKFTSLTLAQRSQSARSPPANPPSLKTSSAATSSLVVAES